MAARRCNWLLFQRFDQEDISAAILWFNPERWPALRSRAASDDEIEARIKGANPSGQPQFLRLEPLDGPSR